MSPPVWSGTTRAATKAIASHAMTMTMIGTEDRTAPRLTLRRRQISRKSVRRVPVLAVKLNHRGETLIAESGDLS